MKHCNNWGECHSKHRPHRPFYSVSVTHSSANAQHTYNTMQTTQPLHKNQKKRCTFEDADKAMRDHSAVPEEYSASRIMLHMDTLQGRKCVVWSSRYDQRDETFKPQQNIPMHFIRPYLTPVTSKRQRTRCPKATRLLLGRQKSTQSRRVKIRNRGVYENVLRFK